MFDMEYIHKRKSFHDFYWNFKNSRENHDFFNIFAKITRQFHDFFSQP